jgi:hypothetical protein
LVFRFFRYWRSAEPASLLRELRKFFWITIQDCCFIVCVTSKWIFLAVIDNWLVQLLRHISEYYFLLINCILKCYRLLLWLIVTLRLWWWLLALDIQLVRLLLNLPWFVEILNNRFIIDINETILFFNELRLQLSSCRLNSQYMWKLFYHLLPTAPRLTWRRRRCKWWVLLGTWLYNAVIIHRLVVSFKWLNGSLSERSVARGGGADGHHALIILKYVFH